MEQIVLLLIVAFGVYLEYNTPLLGIVGDSHYLQSAETSRCNTFMVG